MRCLPLLLSACLPVCAAAQTVPTYPKLPTETPATVTVPAGLADYTRRTVMIPMRDGVKLNTVILVPKSATAKARAAILLTRTPYNAVALTTNALSTHLGPTLYGYDNATDVVVDGGYIRVIQDVRGKYGSEGDYVMNRPFRGPLNPTPVDNSTDTYDTIDWLIKNVPESNGKVGILGISYNGFTSLAALVGPHPALKAAVPMNPMVDGWRGDDWFHNGAFRQQNIPYIYEQDGSRDNSARWLTSTFDDYDMWMRAGSAGDLARERGVEQMGFWRKTLAHPAYDSFWQGQAVDQILAAQAARQPLSVPTLLVHSELTPAAWPDWLADDQREASGRPDVAVFTSDVLTQPVTIAGQPVANLVASTSGTDSDWVVKLIDVFPDEVAGRPKMGGYQFMIAADIFRGRYRTSLSKPEAIPANTPELYRFALPNANHVFLPGHRIMVQVQSSWFPLYDRNPQTFVPSIFEAQPRDYRSATQEIYHSEENPSFIELPLVE